MAQIRGMKKQQPHNRLETDLPKIGIRPTIDGRYGGVRESLEDQTMGMAQRAAKLIKDNVRHSCGLPVEVVISSTCIGGAAEAARCEAEFKRQNVGVSLTVTPCWCYGSETIDLDPHRSKAIWGFNGTERPGAVYLAAALAGHSQKGLPAFGIYGQDVQDGDDQEIPPDVAQKIVRFAKCGLAVATMKGTSYLSMGGTAMGIAGSIVDHDFFQKYFGIRVESIDLTEFVRRMERGIYDKKEYQKALKWVKANCPEGKDYNPKKRSRKHKDQEWEQSVQMALIAKDLMIGNPALEKMGYIEESRGHNALLGGFQGQRQWTDHLANGDFMEAILNTSFDWNGIRQPFTVATENDSLNGISMLFSHLLTGTAQLFADVRTYWSAESVERVTGYELEGLAKNGILHLINSGPSALDWTGEATQNKEPLIKPFWDLAPREAGAMLDATKWCAAITEYFPGGGWSSNFLTKGEMPVTMCRINLVDGLGPALQIAEGHAVNLPPKVHNILDQRTNPSWPATWFVPHLTGQMPFESVYSVMNNWGANHGAICYGHIGADLITLASMLRIPVDMHNVDSSQIFRPSAWSRFGAHERQGADYRACQNYGPLYG